MAPTVPASPPTDEEPAYRRPMTQPGSSPDPLLLPGHLSARAQPLLSAAGLVCRPWVLSDAPVLVRAYADPDIHRWHARSLTLDQAESWVAYETDRWKRERGCSWAITRAGDVLGRIAFGGLSLEEGRAEISYWVLPEARRLGVASLAVSALADWAFNEGGFHRLELEHSTRNQPSCGVAARAGFTAEGTKRSHALHLDGWHDMHAHGLLAIDCPVVPDHG